MGSDDAVGVVFKEESASAKHDLAFRENPARLQVVANFEKLGIDMYLRGANFAQRL